MKAKQNVFRLTLRSNSSQIAKVEPFLNKVNRTLHLDEIQFHKLMVSVTEAVNNAIIHGNKSHPSKRVIVICEIRPGWLVVIVSDQGKGFKVERVSSPIKDENVLKESGRGIFLMKTLMDKVIYDVNQSGVQVQLWLDLSK
ncbi:MAG: ATP-binding protein [Ignavibacteria bacterium]|nr:ATP-binding protein [Ignavibacteria bacterium]